MTTTSGAPGWGPLGRMRARAGRGPSFPSRPRCCSRFCGPRAAWAPSAMAPAPRSLLSPPILLLLLLLSLALLGARAEPAAGSAVPAQSRPCVDCHAFEFMQRALQDLRKTAYSLDARTETLLLQAERRALCACWPAGR
ncbi:RGD1560394 (predicted), isoform CRA_b [Rattus norvegicus]|uniref:NELL2-interacting cell ontogeny regulator 1 n=3 Tax=Rattus norvegicus TaxID=10116 RepID=A6IK45_RAT|nr:RGD1560394 (predicted), isoform CRA_b [Rattus norvegicus]|eukprot:XP_006251255.1 PREDICTED: neuropeptide-like protein C4orf48 homolog isoform X1 [Rattus norvegicus]